MPKKRYRNPTVQKSQVLESLDYQIKDLICDIENCWNDSTKADIKFQISVMKEAREKIEQS